MYLKSRKVDTKFFLWTLFVAQLFLLAVFWMFSSVYNETTSGYPTSFDVQFVTSPTNSLPPLDKSATPLDLQATANRTNQFIVQTINGTGEVTCFREGTTSIDTKITSDGNDTSDNVVEGQSHCICEPEWHGPDCGQPEVVWRAFMTAKVSVRMSAAARPHPRRVVYFIHATGLSIETLEPQLMELIAIVDVFVLCDRAPRSSGYAEEAIGQHMSTGFFGEYLLRTLLVVDRQCSARAMYRKVRARLRAASMTGDDIILYTEADEILNRKAVNYFRWYDGWPQPVRFRLKYTVYGFFWQHPESTRLGGGACRISMLDETFHGDPERIAHARKPDMIVGDLNHFGGWFCRLCAQPADIVRRLEAGDEREAIAHQTATIDALYVQNLIAQGLFVDAKLGLTKVRRFVDKYYAPEFVTLHSWRFDNILLNIFASWDDDGDEM